MDDKKRILIGVRQGGGPEPGYAWSMLYLTVARDEALRFLDEAQYEHVIDQLSSLATEVDPGHPTTVTVEAIEDVFELKEKGGPLGRINVRVFFAIDREHRALIVLGAIKKENNGPTPRATRRLMGVRCRKYRNGEYGQAG